MFDLVGIDVHMSYIHNLKFITSEPPSGYKGIISWWNFTHPYISRSLIRISLKVLGAPWGNFRWTVRMVLWKGIFEEVTMDFYLNFTLQQCIRVWPSQISIWLKIVDTFLAWWILPGIVDDNVHHIRTIVWHYPCLIGNEPQLEIADRVEYHLGYDYHVLHHWSELKSCARRDCHRNDQVG